MKQHITKEQLAELSFEEYCKFIDGIKLEPIAITVKSTKEFVDLILNGDEELPSIGQMIEFLGDTLIQISNGLGNGWAVSHTNAFTGDEPPIEELADALWEAVKYKLK